MLKPSGKRAWKTHCNNLSVGAKRGKHGPLVRNRWLYERFCVFYWFYCLEMLVR